MRPKHDLRANNYLITKSIWIRLRIISLHHRHANCIRFQTLSVLLASSIISSVVKYRTSNWLTVSDFFSEWRVARKPLRWLYLSICQSLYTYSSLVKTYSTELWKNYLKEEEHETSLDHVEKKWWQRCQAICQANTAVDTAWPRKKATADFRWLGRRRKTMVCGIARWQ